MHLHSLENGLTRDTGLSHLVSDFVFKNWLRVLVFLIYSPGEECVGISGEMLRPQAAC